MSNGYLWNKNARAFLHNIVYGQCWHINFHWSHADNKIYVKQHKEVSDAAPIDYEVPMEREQHENVYELEPGPYEQPTPISEEIYEPVSSPNIYCVPTTTDQVHDQHCTHTYRLYTDQCVYTIHLWYPQTLQVQSLPELSPDYSDLIQQVRNHR